MINFHNLEAEKALLCKIIMNNDAFYKVSDILEAKHFSQDIYANLYNFITEKLNNEKPVDVISIVEFFGDNSDARNEILNTDGMLRVRDYAFILIDCWKKRELNTILIESRLKLENGDNIEKITALIDNELAKLDIQSNIKPTQHVSNVIDGIKERRKLGIKPNIISTGFLNLDAKLNGGFYSKQLAIIGARTAVGKTTLLQDIALRASKNGKKCLFVSLEVDSDRVTFKFLSNLSSIPAWKIAKNFLNATEYEKVAIAEKDLSNLGVYINDSTGMKAKDIERLIKNKIAEEPVDAVFIDYVQHIAYENQNTNSATMEISKNVVALKAMAQKFDVAMIAAAQINRGGVDKPTLAHFEGSSAIEKNADVAIIIHREELGEEKRRDSYYSMAGTWILAKNRDGKSGDIHFQLEGEFGRFTEIDNF